jgi:hypothetical protein
VALKYQNVTLPMRGRKHGLVAASPSLFSLSPCRARAAVNVDVPHGCHVATCFRLLNWVACSQSRLHRLQQDPIGSPTRSLPCPVLLFFFQFADSRMEETHKSAVRRASCCCCPRPVSPGFGSSRFSNFVTGYWRGSIRKLVLPRPGGSTL